MTLPKLNLRDLFWIVVVVALLIVWGTDHVRLTRQIELLAAPRITPAE
jgi:hypothetical protein